VALTKIRFPCAFPSLLADMKVGISFALVGAIVGKFVAGNYGIGFQIWWRRGSSIPCVCLFRCCYWASSARCCFSWSIMPSACCCLGTFLAAPGAIDRSDRSRTDREPIFEPRLVGAYSLFAIFGSSTSRNASPIRLTLKTVTARNTPGIKIKPGYS